MKLTTTMFHNYNNKGKKMKTTLLDRYAGIAIYKKQLPWHDAIGFVCYKVRGSSRKEAVAALKAVIFSSNLRYEG